MSESFPMAQAPSEANAFHAVHATLLADSYAALLGRPLIDDPAVTDDPAARARRLYALPAAVLSHDRAADPIFTYGNSMALSLFELDWSQLTSMPSRLSAEAAVQSERDRLLERVARDGYIDDYTGVRISLTGQRFFVEKSVVWNLLADPSAGRASPVVGQAALLSQWHRL